MSRRLRSANLRGRTFLNDVLAGDVLPEDIETYAEAWHDAPDGSPIAQLELHDYLGLTWDEYRLWVEEPQSLRFTLAARRAQVPIDQLLKSVQTVGAAARTADATEAEKVLDWLEARGRIKKVQRNG